MTNVPKSSLSKNVLQMKVSCLREKNPNILMFYHLFIRLTSIINEYNIHFFYFQFMRRSALQIEKEKSEEEKQKVIDDEHWVLDLPETEHKE